MDEDRRCEVEVLPAVVERRRPRRELVVHDDLERLRREVAAPDDRPRRRAPTPSTPTPTSSRRRSATRTRRKAYKRAVDRFLGWCQLRGLELRQVTSFLVGDYVEHHLNDKDGHPLSPPSKKQHLAALRHFFDNQQMYHGVVHQPRLQRPRPEVLRPRGQDARLRRQAGPRPPRLGRHAATSSGSATRRCS